MLSGLRTVVSCLEAVAQADLHHARRALNCREVRPVRWRIKIAKLRVAGYAEARTAAVNRTEGLIVGDVKHFPTKLQSLLFIPGHLYCLAKPDICIHVSWGAQVVAGAGFTRVRIAEALVNGFDVAIRSAKKLWRSRTARAGGNRADRSYVGLKVPIGGP